LADFGFQISDFGGKPAASGVRRVYICPLSTVRGCQLPVAGCRRETGGVRSGARGCLPAPDSGQ
jgi:hypothetical protein